MARRKRCPYCNKLYSPSYLKRHIREQHGVSPAKADTREKIKGRPNYYVHRDKKGRFTDWTEIFPRGVAIDASKKAKKRLKKSGRGHRGDYKKRKKRG